MNNLDLDFSNLCRICLTRTNHMVHLTSSFNEIFVETVVTNKSLNLSIADVINIVLNFTPKLSGQHPQFICLKCLDTLKTVYDFWMICDESQQIIQQCLGEPEEEIIPNKPNELNAPVELIAGPNKYDLNDLLIVEDEKDHADELLFEGFLKNLGKSITATFVDNSKKNSKIDLPSVEVEALAFDNKKEYSVLTKTRQRSNSFDEYILVEGKELLRKTNEENVILSENYINALDNIDKDMLESVMNLKYECTSCKKLFSREVRYKKHVELCRIKSNFPKTNRFSSRLRCRYCTRTFSQRKYLNYHVKMSHKVSFYICEICKTQFKDKRTLDYHKTTKHAQVQHVCQYCGKALVTASALKLHIETHTNRNTTQCICPVCGKTFHYKGGLFYHMKNHNNERKYKCEFCDFSFYTSVSKQRHVRTHTGVRPFACQFCDKRFFSSSEKKRHEWIHTGTLPYRCKYCSKGFTSNYNMKVHCFTHGGDFTCEYCNKSFIDDGVLQFHYKVKHKDLSANEDSS